MRGFKSLPGAGRQERPSKTSKTATRSAAPQGADQEGRTTCTQLYRVAPDDVIEVEKVSGDAGEIIQFSEVLMLGGEGAPQVGTPAIDGASVAAQVVEQKRGDKIIVFKKKRRKNYRRTHGHRQHQTVLKITGISAGA